MFTSLAIKNFRGFKDLKVEPLDRVNLIAGKNNTGKTAVLEAIYLHCNPCDTHALFDLNRLRGVNSQKPAGVLDWVFFDGSSERAAQFQTADDRSLKATSRIELVDLAALQRPEYQEAVKMLPLVRGDFWGGRGPIVAFRYDDSSPRSEVSISTPNPATGELVSLATRSWKPHPCIFAGSHEGLLLADDDAFEAENRLFSNLDTTGRDEQVLDALRQIEPRLKALSLNLFNDRTVIHAEFDGLGHKIPIMYAGEGTRRLLLILLAMGNAQGGAVLVDEVESGLHYSVLSDVWRTIAGAARRLDVQVFATTHSWECIRTAHEAFSQDGPYDLRLHRLDRVDGNVQAVTYDQETLETSIGLNWEVR